MRSALATLGRSFGLSTPNKVFTRPTGVLDGTGVLADRRTESDWQEGVCFGKSSRIFICFSHTVKLQHRLWADAQGGVVLYSFVCLFFEGAWRLGLGCSGGTFVAFALLCLSAAYMQGEAASEADNDLTSV